MIVLRNTSMQYMLISHRYRFLYNYVYENIYVAVFIEKKAFDGFKDFEFINNF